MLNMAAPCRSVIENYVVGCDDSASKELSKDLTEQRVTLTEIVENLGDFLTTTEISSRSRATRLVADISNNVPQDFFSHQQVSLLTTFLCEKLKDHHSIQPHAVYGLSALSKSPYVTSGILETICATIFKEVHVQSLAQADRRNVFNILLTFLTTHLQDVQKMGSDFVYGYIQVIDSEKDPRNLILAFSCAQIVIENLPLSMFVEEMFEVVSCYFPIDFAPSVSDPSGIKKEDLVLGLRKCLAATPLFAEYCLPLLLEKLTSNLKSAKIDALDTLAECCKTYGADKLYEYQSSFFNVIKKEVFISGDSAVEEASLNALNSLVTTISVGVSQSDRQKSLDGFVEEILQETQNNLLHPELMLMLSTGRLLQAAADASMSACMQIVKVTVPLLIETYYKQTQATPKHNLIWTLNGFIKCTLKFGITYDYQILAIYKDSIFHIYSQAIAEDVTSIQQLGVTGFHTMVSLPKDCLMDTERSFITATLVHLAISPSCLDEIRQECAKTILYLLSNYQDNVQKDVFPLILSKLSTNPIHDHGEPFTDQSLVLDVLPLITCGSKNLQIVTDVLYAMIQNSEMLQLIVHVSRCLSNLAAKNADDPDCILVLTTGVRIVLDLVMSKCRCHKWYHAVAHSHVLTNLSSFMRHIATHWDQGTSLEIQSVYVPYYLNGGPEPQRCHCCTENERHLFEDQPLQFCPLQPGVDAVFISLLLPLICSGRPELLASVPQLQDVTQGLLKLSFQPLNEFTHTNVCKCLAALINKYKQDKHLDELLSDFKKRLSSELNKGAIKSENHEIQGHLVTLLAWITKALVLRNHSTGKDFLSMLLDLLSDSALGRMAAHGFCIILTDNEDVFTKEMFANIKLMYKQRLFVENLALLLDGYNKASKDKWTNYLFALSHLIQGLNKQVLIPELPKIYPLLIQSLLCDDFDLQLVTMRTLTDLIGSAPDVVVKQLDSLIPRLLKLTTFQPSMKVRIAALKCLTELSSLPVQVMIQYQSCVVRGLKPALDDKKRLVRSQAVIASQEWILLEMEKKS